MSQYRPREGSRLRRISLVLLIVAKPSGQQHATPWTLASETQARSHGLNEAIAVRRIVVRKTKNVPLRLPPN